MVNENSVFQEILIQKIYANLLKVVVENKEESFIQAKDLFFENYEDLSQNNQKDILGYLVNFTTIQWNKGNTKYTPDGFELLKFGFENGLFLNVPNIESLFINIVLKGVFLKRGKWLESFISKNNQYLREDSKESVVIFCKSFIAYSQQQFSEARNLLMSYRFVRQQDKLRAKSLLIRAIYEDFINDESQYSLLSANIAAFQKYIKRNRKLSRHREISYLNFLKILNQIAKYRYFRKNNYYTLKRNFDEFKDIKFITNKNWLEDKILELK